MIEGRKTEPNAYLGCMFKAFEFCIPITGTKVPAGPKWLHEIKYDGFRIRVERDDDRVRLITRAGYDWTRRYPWIVEAALKNRQKRFVIDGEAVILGVDGISDFNALHSGKHNEEAQLCAFDLLAMDGDDLRDLPLSMRKANLARLLARRPDGIFLSDFEQGEVGPDLFRAACRMGLKPARGAYAGRNRRRHAVTIFHPALRIRRQGTSHHGPRESCAIDQVYGIDELVRRSRESPISQPRMARNCRRDVIWFTN